MVDLLTIGTTSVEEEMGSGSGSRSKVTRSVWTRFGNSSRGIVMLTEVRGGENSAETEGTENSTTSGTKG